MNDRDLQDVGSAPRPAKPRWATFGAILAWTLTLAVIAVITVGGRLKASDAPTTAPDRIGVQEALVGRVVLGLAPVAPASARDNAAALAQGSPIDRVAHAILLAAIDGPDVGDEALDAIAPGEDASLDGVVTAVRRAFELARSDEQEDAAGLTEDQLATLRDELGWFGELASALSDPSEMQRLQESALVTMMTLVGFVAGMILVGGIGLVALVVLVILAVTTHRTWPVVPTAAHAVYAETFAIWLAVFFLAQLGLEWLVAKEILSADLRFGGAALMFFASLIALVWPRLRGLPWSRIRADIGLTRFSPVDIPCGVATYAMSLPFLGVGVIVTLILQAVVVASGTDVAPPSHPVQEVASGARGPLLLQLFLVAVVAAPVVEEIFFRGVLYAHLRGASRAWYRGLSIAFSAVLSAVVFAIIHPQGPVFAPVLAGLAVGFCVGREWRGSIYASIVAHAINNAIVLSLSVLLMGG